jgi:2-methylcitrate dehydratase PrpD
MPLIDRRPQTGLEGKFSLGYCTAAALVDGAVRISSFTDDAVRRPDVSRLLDATEVVEDQEPQSNPLAAWAELRLALAGGSDRSLRVDVPKGDPRRPLTWDELAAKFRDCAAPLLQPEEAAQVIETIERLDRLQDVRQLTAILAGERAEAT